MKFVMKWIINAAIVIPLLVYFAGVSFISSAIAASLLTLVSYFIGDQLILRASNNTIATVTDAVLSFLFFWGAASSMNWSLSFSEILAITLFLGIGEWFIHRYIFQARLTV